MAQQPGQSVNLTKEEDRESVRLQGELTTQVGQLEGVLKRLLMILGNQNSPQDIAYYSSALLDACDPIVERIITVSGKFEPLRERVQKRIQGEANFKSTLAQVAKAPRNSDEPF